MKPYFKLRLMNGTLLFFSVLAVPSYAADVSSWDDIKSNKNASLINMLADITVEGTATPISFNLAEPQTFDGNGHSITGASGYSFVFNNTADVTIQNLGSYSNGTAASNTFSFKNLDGNTVYKTIDKSVNSFPQYFVTAYKAITLNVDNSAFSNNNARLFVLSKNGETLNITDSIFYDNHTTTGSAIIDANTAGTTTNIENSIFYNNSSTSDGGTIKSRGHTFITNSYFINNSSSDDGGVMSLLGTHTGHIVGSKFENNTSGGDGGAIALETTTYEISQIKDSQFIGNRSSLYNDGGAISTMGGYIKSFENVLFENNYSGIRGGGLWEGLASAHNNKDPILLKNVTFKSNESGAAGGMFTEGARTRYTYIVDSEFSNNTVLKANHYMWYQNPLGGGLMSAGGVPMTIINTTFSENTANSTSTGYSAGGGIYFAGEGSASYPLKIVDSTFTSNSALEGGALFLDNADAAIIASASDVLFSSNTALADAADYNGGADIYFQSNLYDATLSLNAADGKKIVFDGSIASYVEDDYTSTININKSGVTYNTYDGTTETSVSAGTAGEIQFNNRVGDDVQYFTNINLYGGTLSIGQNAELNANFDNPDGLINDNNFSVEGASTLNTANGIIGEFAPRTFTINADLAYQFDVNLADATSDKLTGAVNNGSLTLSVLNVIEDTDQQNLKVIYSDTNINGILKDGYIITTSTASYDVTADNDDTGSYLLFSKSEDTGGLPSAIKNGSASYSNTSGADEVITSWQGTNSLSADLVINGNKHAITTENSLNGINVGNEYTLTMNDVSNMTGFNYALNNEGTVELNNTTIEDSITNNGTLDINSNVSIGALSGTGTTNVNADYELVSAFSGNTLNVNNATLSGTQNLAADVDINAVGGTIDIADNTVTVNSATFDANSTLSLSINSLTEYGSLNAQNITVANGAKLEATLSQGLVDKGDTVAIQLINADNEDFNNFSNTLDNNMYHFEKADNNGKYNVTLVNTAEDVVNDAGGEPWVSEAAKAYIDSDAFTDPIAADVANKLAALAQNDSGELITEIKALAPTETAVVEDHVIQEGSRLFKTVDGYLRGERDPFGLSSGDMFDDTAIWARPYVGKAKVHQSAKIIEQSSKSMGIITGFEKKASPNLKVGVGLHYDKTDVDTLKRHIGITTFVGFLYSEYKPADWFINMTGSFGQSHYDEKKYALGTKFKANYSVHTTSLATTLGYQFKNFTPEVAMHYYHIKREGYTDTAAQHVERSSTNYLRATSGVRYTKEYGIFRSDIYVGLGYDVLLPENNTVVSLANGTHYVVDGRNLSRLEYELNIGFNASLTDRITLGTSYMGAYRENYREHTGIVRLKYDF